MTLFSPHAGPRHDENDGIDLTGFQVGQVYDIGTSLASYLTASGYAMPVADEPPAPPVEEGVMPDSAPASSLQSNGEPGGHKPRQAR